MKEDIPSRQIELRKAVTGSCSFWAPIIPAERVAESAEASGSDAPVSTKVNNTDSTDSMVTT